MFFTVKSPKQSVQGSDIRSPRTVADSYANFSEYLENRVLDLASGVLPLAEHGINSADGDDVQVGILPGEACVVALCAHLKCGVGCRPAGLS